jgi:hypothetical protein
VLVYIDEKWFYLSSRHKKSKHLPRAEFEPEEADKIRVRRVINKSHPVKTMFMGLITKPIPEQNFNGAISIKWLRRQHVIQ